MQPQISQIAQIKDPIMRWRAAREAGAKKGFGRAQANCICVICVIWGFFLYFR